jgi:hypothetical protein
MDISCQEVCLAWINHLLGVVLSNMQVLLDFLFIYHPLAANP